MQKKVGFAIYGNPTRRVTIAMEAPMRLIIIVCMDFEQESPFAPHRK